MLSFHSSCLEAPSWSRLLWLRVLLNGRCIYQISTTCRICGLISTLIVNTSRRMEAFESDSRDIYKEGRKIFRGMMPISQYAYFLIITDVGMLLLLEWCTACILIEGSFVEYSNLCLMVCFSCIEGYLPRFSVSSRPPAPLHHRYTSIVCSLQQ